MIRTSPPRVVTVEEDMVVAAAVGLQAGRTVTGTDIQSRRFCFLDLEFVLALFSLELRE
jgi:hypothetical protein